MSPADNSRSFNSTELFGHGAELLRIWQEVALPELARHGPLFTGKLKALLETVRRMELWMESMQLFKDPSHHQAAAAGARALFELVLDVKALAADTDGLMLEKFEAFPEVEHFRVSQKLVAFYRRPGQTASLKDFAERAAYVDDTARRDRIYETCRKLWGRDPAKDPIRGWPKHWTNQGTDQRSRGFGPAFEEHPYRFVRHPSYSGLLLAFIGLGVSFQSWLSILVLLVPIVPAVANRVAKEERALLSFLGPPYAAYCARTKRFIPWVA